MTDNEGLRPHELAEQIMQTEYEIVDGRIESRRLGQLIDRSQTVWSELACSKFAENEYGHATIGIDDWVGDYLTDSGDHVDGLRVYFHDPRGNITELGSISRVGGSYGEKATAIVVAGEGKTEPLLPTDNRWDAVVGTIEHAIDTCTQRKLRGRRQ